MFCLNGKDLPMIPLAVINLQEQFYLYFASPINFFSILTKVWGTKQISPAKSYRLNMKSVTINKHQNCCMKLQNSRHFSNLGSWPITWLWEVLHSISTATLSILCMCFILLKSSRFFDACFIFSESSDLSNKDNVTISFGARGWSLTAGQFPEPPTPGGQLPCSN